MAGGVHTVLSSRAAITRTLESGRTRSHAAYVEPACRAVAMLAGHAKESGGTTCGRSGGTNCGTPLASSARPPSESPGAA
jgi:hypothetical protein